MKVHLIRKKTIERFAQQNAGSRKAFNLWLLLLKRADWIVPEDIITTYPSADSLGNGTNRVVFNIAGNQYRMICKYHWGITMIHLSVKWIGTHASYDMLCSKNEQYTVSLY